MQDDNWYLKDLKRLFGAPPLESAETARDIYFGILNEEEFERYIGYHPVTLPVLIDAHRAGDWAKFVGRHHDAYKTLALREAARRGLGGAAYWELLLDTFIMQHHVSVNIDLWAALFARRTNPGPRSAMSPGDLSVFDALPDPFTAYRGARPHQARGLSWTLDIETARFFAARQTDGRMYTARIPKKDALMYISEEPNGRSESEVLVLPTSALQLSIYKPKKPSLKTAAQLSVT